MSEIESLAHLVNLPGAPYDERDDASRRLSKTLFRNLDPQQFANFREGIDYMLTQQDELAKAVQMQGWQRRLTSREQERVVGRGYASVLYLNEYGLPRGGGGGKSRFVEKPSLGGFQILKQVAGVDMVQVIILTILRQVYDFCQPENERNPLGFVIARKDKQKLTADDKKEAARITSFLQNCGDEADPAKRKRLGRDTFPTFMQKIARDSLTFDACPAELEETRSGELSGMYAVDGSTIRLCSEDGYEGDQEVQAIQVVDGIPYTAYGFKDLIYEVRNPRTDLVVNGYGMAEGEVFLRVLTAWVNSFTYNAAGVDRNAMPRNLAMLFGNWEQAEVNEVSRRVRSQLTGPGNRFGFPFIAIPPPRVGGEHKGMEVVKIDGQHTEMFLAKWTTLLWSIACATFGMHPNNVNMDAFDSKSASPMSGKDTTEKLAHSRDKCLIPMLGFLQGIPNAWIIPRLNPKFELLWTGLNEEDEARKWEREKTTATIDEMRISGGKERHPNRIIGDAPANRDFLQLYTQTIADQLGYSDEDGSSDFADDRDDEDNPSKRTGLTAKAATYRPRRSRRPFRHSIERVDTW